MNNKNLAKKGTIIALALAVVIGMSYFSSQDYLNMSIMDMLLGGTTKCCDFGSCPWNTSNGCNPGTYHITGWPATVTVTTTDSNGNTVTLENNVSVSVPTGSHIHRRRVSEDPSGKTQSTFESDLGVTGNEEPRVSAHHKTPVTLGGTYESSNGEVLRRAVHAKVNNVTNSKISAQCYCWTAVVDSSSQHYDHHISRSTAINTYKYTVP